MKTQYLLALLALLAYTAATPLQEKTHQKVSKLAEECPDICPRIFNPVCATDATGDGHKYFHNECLMRYESCHGGKAWSITRMGLCLEELEPYVRDECLRPCHFIYMPVCATDGKNFQVFGNACVFGVENCFANGRWIATRESHCGL